MSYSVKAERVTDADPNHSASIRNTPALRDHWQSHAVSLLIIGAAFVAMFWRIFFQGETLVDLATLNNQLPWGYEAGASDYAYNRRDLTDMYVTREYFVVAAYRAGEAPLWNPYTMCGHPIYADGVTKILSPFLLFYRFFDVPTGYSFARITELLLAAVFMYLFLVNIGAGSSGGLAGALVFAFSSHSMMHLTGLGWWGGLMWLPLILLFAIKAATRGSYFHATLSGLFLALQFFCGYLPNQIYYVGAIALTYLFFGTAQSAASGELRWTAAIASRFKQRYSMKAGLLLLTTLAVGFGLSATQWLPVFELLKYSNRRIVPTEISFIYLPPWYALTWLFPHIFGAAYDAEAINLFTAINVSHDHILYFGAAALLPVGFALYWLRRTSKTRDAGEATSSPTGIRIHIVFFSILAVIALLMMMATPLYVHVTKFIPVLQSIRVTVRAGVLLVFATSILTALGLRMLLESRSELLNRFAGRALKFCWICFAFVLACAGIALLARESGFAFDDQARGALAFAHRAALKVSGQFLPPDTNIARPFLVLVIVAALIQLTALERCTRRMCLVVIMMLLAGDLLISGREFNQSFDASRVFPRTETTDLLRSLPPGRVLVTPAGLETNRRASEDSAKIIAPPNTLLAYNLATVTGKDQLFPKAYREFCSLIEPQPNLSHVVFNQTSSPLLDLMNTRYVLTYASAPAPPNSTLLASAEGTSVYENLRALPRAFLVRKLIGATSHEEALSTLRNNPFDPRTAAVIENSRSLSSRIRDPEAMQLQGSQTSSLGDEIAIVEDRRNRTSIDVQTGSDALLVLSDNYYPGWRATIDRQPVEILRANYTMRAVHVPPGRHLVSFEFSPSILRTGAYLSAATAAFVLVLIVSTSLRLRKRRAAGG